MSFHKIHSWTLCGLIRAFFDLAFSYFLLCVSAALFIPSKILKFVGLFFPCPCTGFYGFRKPNFCFHKLVSFPKRKIHLVLQLANGLFPFDLILIHDQIADLDKISHLQSEVCCTSLSGPRFWNSVDNDSEYDGKGKRSLYQRPRAKIQRRRRTSVKNVRLFMGICEGNETRVKGELAALVEKQQLFSDDVNESKHMDLGERTWPGFESSSSVGENNYVDKDSSSIGQGTSYAHESDINRRYLEQSLEEEKAARASLFLELEEERAAAATAADEAIAMITRLQNEKASVEMEARQYQRVIEEKSAYDEEEMNILREILVKREIDYHILEKEIEAYWRMDLSEKELLKRNWDFILDERNVPSAITHYLNVDPPIVHKIENAKLNTTSSCNSQSNFSEEGLLKETIWMDKDDELRDCDFEKRFLSRGELQECSKHIDHAVNDLGSSILDLELDVQDIHVIDEKLHNDDRREGRKVDN